VQWEVRLLELFEDLEQQAGGLHLLERDAEVEDREASEYAQVTLASRCHASVGRELRLRLLGGTQVSGLLVRSGAQWLVLHEQQAAWLVPLEAVGSCAGLGRDAAHESTWSVADRLPLRSLLRRVLQEEPRCRVHLRDGQQLEATLLRVGADFAELRSAGELPAHAGPLLLPLSALAAVRWHAR
jgi:hypothetical protein